MEGMPFQSSSHKQPFIIFPHLCTLQTDNMYELYLWPAVIDPQAWQTYNLRCAVSYLDFSFRVKVVVDQFIFCWFSIVTFLQMLLSLL